MKKIQFEINGIIAGEGFVMRPVVLPSALSKAREYSILAKVITSAGAEYRGIQIVKVGSMKGEHAIIQINDAERPERSTSTSVPVGSSQSRIEEAIAAAKKRFDIVEEVNTKLYLYNNAA